MTLWTAGHAEKDGAPYRGWFVGPYVSDDVRNSDDIELKWAVLEAGQTRESWTEPEKDCTMVILVSGHFMIKFPDGSTEFKKPGDYAMWQPGLTHSWEALEDSTVLTVRWLPKPS